VRHISGDLPAEGMMPGQYQKKFSITVPTVKASAPYFSTLRASI
jgi:hypothetical protein